MMMMLHNRTPSSRSTSITNLIMLNEYIGAGTKKIRFSRLNNSIDEVVVRIRVLPSECLTLVAPEDTIVGRRDVEDVDEECVLLRLVAAFDELGHVGRTGSLEIVQRNECSGAAVADGALGQELGEVEGVDIVHLGKSLDFFFIASTSTFIHRISRGRNTFKMFGTERMI